jgi:hypothetical protein
MPNLAMIAPGPLAGILASPLLFCAVAMAAPSAIAPSPDFLKYWRSGLAEISSYAITAERYGELRRGQGVMVFVYEEIDADSRIKVETEKTPVAKRVPVLKLNNVLKFTTGVYDYSVMTSVFAGLSGPGVQRRLQPQKVSFTSQEWCGSVFHQLLPRAKGLVSEIHSYFEAEGDAVKTLPYPGTIAADGSPFFYYEDELPILIRELDGPILKDGEAKRIQMVPSLWERRKRHVPLAFSEATLTKAGPESRTQGGKKIAAVKWTLELPGLMCTFHVEAAAPRKLLAWENNHGEKGALIASIRNAYWEHNHNRDAYLREKLGLEFGLEPD